MEIKTIADAYQRSAQVALFRNVYLWMTMALAITGLTALIVSDSYAIQRMIFTNQMVWWGLLIAELALVWYLSARINKLSFTSATCMFIVYSILNGATLSVIMMVYTAESIASTFFITAGTFAAMSLIGYFTKKRPQFAG